MKKLGLTVMAILTVVSLSLAAPKLARHKGAKGKTFTGAIMDSQCAMNGSHEQMQKMHNMPASTDLTGEGAKNCTLECVKMGGKFVLYNKATKTTYQLDDQEKPRDFAGQEVRVTGTYDKATKTIHVASIAAAS